jgi:hypothetical protein
MYVCVYVYFGYYLGRENCIKSWLPVYELNYLSKVGTATFELSSPCEILNDWL